MPFWPFRGRKRRKLPEKPKVAPHSLGSYRRQYGEHQAIASWVLHHKIGGIGKYDQASRIAEAFLRSKPEKTSEAAIRAFVEREAQNLP